MFRKTRPVTALKCVKIVQTGAVVLKMGNRMQLPR